MKRLNPVTNQPFRRGDIRSDGYIFFSYSTAKNLSGYFKEIWLRPEVSEKVKVGDRQRKKRAYDLRV